MTSFVCVQFEIGHVRKYFFTLVAVVGLCDGGCAHLRVRVGVSVCVCVCARVRVRACECMCVRAHTRVCVC